ncbi:MAG TPA: glycosyl hydrolase family 5, partial [Chitinophagaceae bacterium]|nr:glycosyl hydrolase family 5 [Chitinophagaceae bacterium]
MNLLKAFTISLFTLFSLNCQSQNSGFLKADGKRIVNGRGENVLLRGIGLGGWMVQEGYMLHINKEGQQYRIRQRIEALLTPQQT